MPTPPSSQSSPPGPGSQRPAVRVAQNGALERQVRREARQRAARGEAAGDALAVGVTTAALAALFAYTERPPSGGDPAWQDWAASHPALPQHPLLWIGPTEPGAIDQAAVPDAGRADAIWPEATFARLGSGGLVPPLREDEADAPLGRGMDGDRAPDAAGAPEGRAATQLPPGAPERGADLRMPSPPEPGLVLPVRLETAALDLAGAAPAPVAIAADREPAAAPVDTEADNTAADVPGAGAAVGAQGDVVAVPAPLPLALGSGDNPGDGRTPGDVGAPSGGPSDLDKPIDIALDSTFPEATEPSLGDPLPDPLPWTTSSVDLPGVATLDAAILPDSPFAIWTEIHLF